MFLRKPSSGLPRFRRTALLAFVLAACSQGGILLSDDLRLSECPEAVRATIRQNQRDGKVEEIKKVEVEGHALYLVEIDLKGFRELKLHISGTGSLRKSVEEIRQPDLPEPVKESAKHVIHGLYRIGDIEKITEGEQIRYRIKAEHPGKPDILYLFDEDGSMGIPK